MRGLGLLPVVLLLSAAGPSGASAPSLVGGFHAVGADEGAYALWYNPAAIGLAGRPATVVEVFAFEGARRTVRVGEGGEEVRPSGLRALSAAAATDRAAYGVQWEFDDVPGVPDWTFSAGRRGRLARRIFFGTAFELRGGDSKNLDAHAGLIYVPSPRFRAAVVAKDLFQSDSDGMAVRRTWRAGVSVRFRRLSGRATYDLVRSEGGESDSRHWFGFAFDRTKPVRVSFFADEEGDWSASVEFVVGNNLYGAGAQRPRHEPRRDFLAVQWRPLGKGRVRRGGWR